MSGNPQQQSRSEPLLAGLLLLTCCCTVSTPRPSLLPSSAAHNLSELTIKAFPVVWTRGTSRRVMPSPVVVKTEQSKAQVLLPPSLSPSLSPLPVLNGTDAPLAIPLTHPEGAIITAALRSIFTSCG